MMCSARKTASLLDLWVYGASIWCLPLEPSQLIFPRRPYSLHLRNSTRVRSHYLSLGLVSRRQTLSYQLRQPAGSSTFTNGRQRKDRRRYVGVITLHIRNMPPCI